jgi:phenylpropionate dioxygenase-like ring-hydroxylating dioxygenase large terminal subunit
VSPKAKNPPDDFGPGWYAILSAREVPQDKPLACHRFGLDLVVIRTNAGIRVFPDRCPHRGVKLSAGRLVQDCLECAFHGFRFNDQGQCVAIPVQGQDSVIPQAMQLHRFPAEEAHGYVFMWWGEVPAELPAIDWFDEELAECHGPYERWADCNVGLSRNIENQLDSAHLPFVHKRSIGRFVKSVEMDLESNVQDNRIRLFRRQHPKTYVEMRLPNLWINRIGTRSYVSLAFAPISATRTRIYTRYYQGRFHIPWVRDLLGWVMGWSNQWILREDIRIVEQHDTPISPPLDGSELLLACDIAVIRYRRLRQGWQKL